MDRKSSSSASTKSKTKTKNKKLKSNKESSICLDVDLWEVSGWTHSKLPTGVTCNCKLKRLFDGPTRLPIRELCKLLDGLGKYFYWITLMDGWMDMTEQIENFNLIVWLIYPMTTKRIFFRIRIALKSLSS